MLITDTSRRPTKRSPRPRAGQFKHVLARNISTLVEMRERAEQNKPTQDRVADTITRFTGSMTFVYLHALLFGAWIVVNLGWTPLQPFDSSFVVLAMVASVEAIFLSTFVLISQNRMQAGADKRAELDLQISLLAEHEVTQAIVLLDAIVDRLGIEHEKEPEIEDSKQDVDPAAVMEAIEEEERKDDAPAA